LYARIATSASSSSVGPHREALADEAGQERREAQRRGDAVDVHVGDARVTSHAPRRISSKRVGSKPYSSTAGRRPR
jgi:hypothetical protein